MAKQIITNTFTGDELSKFNSAQHLRACHQCPKRVRLKDSLRVLRGESGELSVQIICSARKNGKFVTPIETVLVHAACRYFTEANAARREAYFTGRVKVG